MKKFSALLIIFTGATLFAQTGGYTVNDLYNLALANSIERALFVNRVDQARGEKETARAGLNPTLSFSGSYSYLGFPPKGVTLEAGELGMIPDMVLEFLFPRKIPSFLRIRGITTSAWG
jgi:outer membrane protein TolC